MIRIAPAAHLPSHDSFVEKTASDASGQLRCGNMPRARGIGHVVGQRPRQAPARRHKSVWQHELEFWSWAAGCVGLQGERCRRYRGQARCIMRGDGAWSSINSTFLYVGGGGGGQAAGRRGLTLTPPRAGGGGGGPPPPQGWRKQLPQQTQANSSAELKQSNK
jgi:hypothetical protein